MPATATATKHQAPPKLSVIVPCYNGEKELYQCLKSLVNQTIKSLEIILVDDASSDASLAIAEQFASHDSRIKIIKHAENKGLSITRNTGIKVATGKYIAFVDHDDYLALDIYSKATAKAEATGAVSVAFNMYRFQGQMKREVSHEKAGRLTNQPELRNALLCAAIYNHHFINAIKLNFPEDRNSAEDHYFSRIFQLEAIKQQKIRIHLGDFGYYYRDTVGSLSKQSAAILTIPDTYRTLLAELALRGLDDTVVKTANIAGLTGRSSYYFTTLAQTKKLQHFLAETGVTADYLLSHQVAYNIRNKLISRVRCLHNSAFIFWLKGRPRPFVRYLKVAMRDLKWRARWTKID